MSLPGRGWVLFLLALGCPFQSTWEVVSELGVLSTVIMSWAYFRYRATVLDSVGTSSEPAAKITKNVIRSKVSTTLHRPSRHFIKRLMTLRLACLPDQTGATLYLHALYGATWLHLKWQQSTVLY